MSVAEPKEDETPGPADEDNVSVKEDGANISVSAPESNKVTILLKATGNAPIMKKQKWVVDVNKPVSWVITFIGRYLKLQPSDSLFLYVNQTFAPSPEQTVKNLYDCFSTDGKLILHYCKTQAWG